MDIEVFAPEDEERVQILQALADPTRLATIRVLKNAGGEIPREQLCAKFTVSNSTFSFHGKTLHDAGLTISRKEGREKFIRINQAKFDEFLPGFLDTL